jgi:hypothetical protein
MLFVMDCSDVEHWKPPRRGSQTAANTKENLMTATTESTETFYSFFADKKRVVQTGSQRPIESFDVTNR